MKVETQWQNSEVTDPLTGETRRISGQRPEDITVNFRQDLPEQNLTFGLGWFQGWRESYYQESSIENLKLRDFFNSFIEWKPDRGLHAARRAEQLRSVQLQHPAPGRSRAAATSPRSTSPRPSAAIRRSWPC